MFFVLFRFLFCFVNVPLKCWLLGLCFLLSDVICSTWQHLCKCWSPLKCPLPLFFFIKFQIKDKHTLCFVQPRTNKLYSLLPSGSSAEEESVSRPPDPWWIPCSDEVTAHLLLAVPGHFSASQSWLSPRLWLTLWKRCVCAGVSTPPHRHCVVPQRERNKKHLVVLCLNAEPRYMRRCWSHHSTDTGMKCHALRKH